MQSCPNCGYNPENKADRFLLRQVVDGYKLIRGFNLEDKEWDGRNWPKFSKPAKQMLSIFKNDWKKAVEYMEQFAKDYNFKGLEFNMFTMVKNYDDFMTQRKENAHKFNY